MSEMSDFDLDQIEAQAESDAARINAGLGEYDTDPQFDFCATCPFFEEFTDDERQTAQLATGWSLGDPGGYSVSLQMVTEEGKRTPAMLAGNVKTNSATGKLHQKIVSVAAERTRNCEGPKTTFRILGPFAIKRCAALRKYNSDW